MKRSKLCYICGGQMIVVPSGHRGPLGPKHLTKDHVPPQGIFNVPKPSNLITACCCCECNAMHSNFDEQLRALCSLELNANLGGQKILFDKVLGSTMAKGRQPEFFAKIHQTMREEEITTSEGLKRVVKLKADRQPIEAGVFNIVKGLLANFYPALNYHGDTFLCAIHSAATAAREGNALEKIMQEIETKTEGQAIGNHKEFRFWRKVEPEYQRGAWLLRFYEGISFIVIHHRATDKFI